MNYKVILEPAAKRQLKKLPPPIQKTLLTRITDLQTTPRPSGCKKLKGKANQYRIRSGNYRIIYSIEDTALIVRIIKAGHRRDAYD